MAAAELRSSYSFVLLLMCKMKPAAVLAHKRSARLIYMLASVALLRRSDGIKDSQDRKRREMFSLCCTSIRGLKGVRTARQIQAHFCLGANELKRIQSLGVHGRQREPH